MNAVITEEYRQQQVELHKNPNYGVASLSIAPLAAARIAGSSVPRPRFRPGVR